MDRHSEPLGLLEASGTPDEMSKRLCPNGFLYRLVGNRQPACLPESYVYDGVWAANVPEEDD